MTDRDVTALIEFGNNDDECLPVTKCLCGEEFPLWDFIIGYYRDWARECPKCGRKFYFENSVRVYEVSDEVSE